MSNKTFPVFGDSVEVMISSQSSEGAMSAIIQTTRPGGGPPPHYHRNEDEILMALEGDFEIFLNNHWTPMICHQPVYLRRSEVHAFRNCGTNMGRIMGIATPGGLDEYLETITSIEMPRELARLFAISEEYGIVFPYLQASEAAGKGASAVA